MGCSRGGAAIIAGVLQGRGAAGGGGRGRMVSVDGLGGRFRGGGAAARGVWPCRREGGPSWIRTNNQPVMSRLL